MGEKLSIKDVVEFAKAGWKPGDVKAIIEAAEKSEVKTEEPAEIPEKDQEQPAPEKEQKGTSEQPKDDASKDELIKQLQGQIEELNGRIKTVQEANTKKDLQGTVQTDSDRLEEIARSFM